ncbi:hypothetical protein C8N43_2732 [Litoreibacter ponti]|uniref:Glycerophosphoryl diester phosphodiesterase membrane domain-containing protein n=1 Tax=Litoreibacter ponti TaxID=1510457 RepID=A0A2T6BPS9_9RHOB|nr:hypothetical protein [Litoreibacter ponti]PTX58056.1 hypothetical protein C8N43_2732 [Litoreibacter ponti]
MRQGAHIFFYGLTQLATNFGAALRLTALVWLLASVAIYGLGYVMVDQIVGATGLRPDAEGRMPALSATFSMLALTINVLAGAYISMVWARYCLEADTPAGVIPSLRGQPFGGVLITLILVVACVGALAFLLSYAGSKALPLMPLLVGFFVFPLITFYLLTWLFLRIGAAIPASAAGEMLSLGQAWKGSGGIGVWLVAALGVVLIAMLAFPTALLSGLLVPGIIVSVLTSWLAILIGTGWLVSIYRLQPEPTE